MPKLKTADKSNAKNVHDREKISTDQLVTKLETISEMIETNGLDDRKQRDVLQCLSDLETVKDIKESLQTFRNKRGDTLALTAVTYLDREDVLKKLLQMSPDLIYKAREGSLKGQTILHIAVVRGKKDLVNLILNTSGKPKDDLQRKTGLVRWKLLKAKATGHKFKNTTMMGQLPLTIAALSYDREMVKRLLACGADVTWQNSIGDTLLHSLVRYTSIFTDNIEKTLEMIKFLSQEIIGQYVSHFNSPSQCYLWHKVNNEKMTPLQLSAFLGQDRLFWAILDLSDIYRLDNQQDGLFQGAFLYDITEIDTVTQAEWERYPTQALIQENFEDDKNKKSWTDFAHKPCLHHESQSVIEILSEMPASQAYPFLREGAVQELIQQKWKHYKHFLYFWFCLHIVFMFHMSVYSMYKTDVLNCYLYPDSTVQQGIKIFVYISAAMWMAYAVICLALEVRRIYLGLKWQKKNSNTVYRGIIVLFSVALLIDSIWFFIYPHNNYGLILALILGWSFTSFFLQTIEAMSFYAMLLFQVLARDLTRMAALILIQLIAFSAAIYSTCQKAQPVEGFEDFETSLLTMFNLMLGLNDISVLDDAREPYLAFSLYVVFVILTYIFLLNSVIAMMSITSERMWENGHQQWLLQRLSVILFIEYTIPSSCRYLPDEYILPIKRYGIPNKEYRCYIKISSHNQ